LLAWLVGQTIAYKRTLKLQALGWRKFDGAEFRDQAEPLPTTYVSSMLLIASDTVYDQTSFLELLEFRKELSPIWPVPLRGSLERNAYGVVPHKMVTFEAEGVLVVDSIRFPRLKDG
jgi:hypothetical protein